MNDNQLKQKIQDSMPETPYGFDTRVDAQVEGLVRQGRRQVKFLSVRRVLALSMVVALLLGGAISYAMNAPVPGHVTIQPRLDRDAHMKDDTWYRDNTMSLVGLSLRDRGMTDKWYNVVPVDLTREGRQTFTLAASGMYYIGEAYVDVSGDQVTVSYGTYRGNLTMGEECLNWFLDVEDVTREYLADPHGSYAFGEPVSIKEQLKGADVALLFICNRVTYRNPFDDKGSSLVRYYPNLKEWKEARAGMEVLMDRLAEQAAAMKTVATPTDAATSTDVTTPTDNTSATDMNDAA